MKLISHRGNLKGPNPKQENHPSSIINCIKKGYDVEIDVWSNKAGFWLGHDNPSIAIPIRFMIKNSNRLWIHCKNLEALYVLKNFKQLNVFWHQDDQFTLTSKNFIWTYPGNEVTKNSVLVTENATTYNGPQCYGLCSDFLE